MESIRQLKSYIHQAAGRHIYMFGLLGLWTLIIQLWPLSDDFSKQEQKWITHTLTHMILIYAGFLIFKLASRESTQNEYFLLVIFLNQILQIYYVIKLYRDGFKLGTREYESYFVHASRMILVFFMDVFGNLILTLMYSFMFSVFIMGGYYMKTQDDSIPHFKYDRVQFHEILECAVCLDLLEDPDNVVQLECSKFHIYHLKCFKNMIESPCNIVCPMCRVPIKVRRNPILI